jgi:hypothetical protein
MSCCGTRRERAVAALAPKVEHRPVTVAPARPPILFEYTGKTSLAVVGPLTRLTYRFSGPGVVVPVSAADAGAVSAVPNLRRSRSL